MKNYRLRTTIFMAALTLVWCFGIFMSSPPVFAEPIIIDHTAVEEFYNIPDEYIEAAKNLTLYFGTTYVGVETIIGLFFLPEALVEDPEDDDLIRAMESKYNFYLRADGEDYDPFLEEGPALYICLETDSSYEDYWSTEEGRAITRAFADTGSYNYSMWAWGDWDYTDYTEGFIQNYLDTLDGFEQDYPDMRFIYTTRYVTDGEGIADDDNDMIRAYCGDNDKVLFDIEDIIAHLPPYDDILWPDPNDYFDEMCIMKAQAFWVMMAKLAGWDGGGRMLGDVNGDETINVMDIIPTGSHIVERITLEGDALWAANVNGDVDSWGQPNINILDIILIAQRIVGIIDKFPIE